MGHAERTDQYDHDLGGEDNVVARRAIEYLAFHSPVVTVRFSEDDPPSEDIRRLMMPYMDGISGDLGELVARYLMQSLANDHLGLSGIEIVTVK
jgi:hypothetical protein